MLKDVCNGRQPGGDADDVIVLKVLQLLLSLSNWIWLIDYSMLPTFLVCWLSNLTCLSSNPKQKWRALRLALFRSWCLETLLLCKTTSQSTSIEIADYTRVSIYFFSNLYCTNLYRCCMLLTLKTNRSKLLVFFMRTLQNHFNWVFIVLNTKLKKKFLLKIIHLTFI